ncbi:MAG: hypothetical protein VB086_02860 [Clostridiaceae bacterium]|nr:hypothetical protein [Clostridiaceae bacterium]
MNQRSVGHLLIGLGALAAGGCFLRCPVIQQLSFLAGSYCLTDPLDYLHDPPLRIAMLIFLGVILYGIILVKKKDTRNEQTAGSAAETPNIPDAQNGQERQDLSSASDGQNKQNP